MKLLSISPVCPYDSVGHAGGKTYNYYLKKTKEKSEIDVRVVFFGSNTDVLKYDLDQYGIPYDSVLTRGNLWADIKHAGLDVLGRIAFRNEMLSLFKLAETMRYLRKLEQKNELPDIIELEWTNFAYFAKYIKKRYPQIKLVASEHDVAYQAFQRKGVSAKKLARVKKQELEALEQCDLILVQSAKDQRILTNDGVQNRILVIVPYYHNMSNIQRKDINHDILFWGAMYRPENYEAAIWFIEKVMPLLSDIPVRFVAAGNRPPEQLKRYAGDRIVVTGFVEDEQPLFESSMCFVSPLLTGAGIKVKVIEALSAGIPILTNEIGAEGMPVVDAESYFHCETPEEYASVIRRIYSGEIDTDGMRERQRAVIKEHMNLERSFESYIAMLQSL